MSPRTRKLVQYVLPTILSQVSFFLFTIIDGIFVGQGIGTDALGVKKANVLGQICPGIPVWQTDPGSKFPGIPYVIFPGNVGGAETLRQAVETLVAE